MVGEKLEADFERDRPVKTGWLKRWVLVLIGLGIVFRLYAPGHKVYWFDETMTSLRISGYTKTELVETTLNQPPISAATFLNRYQYPSEERSLSDALDALAAHPEHSPLYFLMARGWLQTFGNSIGTLRLLSAIIGILAIPAAYWAGVALFESAVSGWAIATVVAISPFHVLYAQEARQYSLWTVAILLSSAALVQAMRRSTVKNWGLYAVTMALGLYAHIFYGLVCISHGLYVLLVEQLRPTRRVLSYAIAALMGLALFSPWLLVMFRNLDALLGNTNVMTEDRQGFLPLFWLLNLSRLFFDLNQGPSAINPMHYLLLILCGYALWQLYRTAPLPTTIFVLTLIGVTAIALMGTDIILGGRRSSITRYPVPAYLGLQLAVGYLLSQKPIEAKLGSRLRKRWRTGAIALAFFGILSIAVNSQHDLWWNKSYAVSRYNPETAEIMNQSDRPLMITDRDPNEVLALVHLLDPEVQIQFIAHPGIADRPPDIRPITPDIDLDAYSDVFLYKPSPGLRRRLDRNGYRSQDIYDDGWLWSVTR
jgi:uncharacterized membrane protein